MGRYDECGVLLAGLRERAKSWQTAWKARLVFARYLGEWSKTGQHTEAVDAVLRDMHANPAEMPVLSLAIIEVGATPERIEWIKSALRAGALDAAAIMELGRRRYWLAGVDDEEVASLVEVLVAGTTIEQPAAALEMMLDHIKEHPEALTRLAALLLRTLERLAPVVVNGMTEHEWEQGAAILIEHGEVARIAELAVIALTRIRGSNDFAWATLHRAAERDVSAVWERLSIELDRRDGTAERLISAFRFHRQSFVWPRDEVLAWVATDEQRARAVVSLVRPYASDLDPILRALIQRFGAHGSVAREIVARIHATDGVTSSLAGHDAEQLTHARRWLEDEDPAITDFAKSLVASLEQSYENHAAREDDERRRYGT
jgi:hypothetical protein